MKISLVTPAGKQSRSGNRATASRWARILRDLGHRVQVAEADDGADSDMMVAVHAWRSAESINQFASRHPDRPLVVTLAGTDIYRFQESHPEITQGSMEKASALICLHGLVHQAIPARFHHKLHVVHQSASPLPQPRAPSSRHFDVCVVGHLRDEKDSLRAALAARLAPPESRLRVLHLGKAHNEEWAQAGADEMVRNPRFVWRGETPGWKVRRLFGQCHAMVMSSRMEGGANVVSEAIVAGLPVLASDIDGNVGLLGDDYDGYYPVEDEAALSVLFQRAETDPTYLRNLSAQIAKRAPLFDPALERAAWVKLIQTLSE
ncbi:MAG: putative glycosyltransferase (TIGR04348 family) [Alphaproteobacteria bacterium]|jgi:putative glycosyltransferase (TIGR04348 family)